VPYTLPTRLDDPNIRRRRERMVERQIAARGIRDARVLAAMREVPREAFVAESMREFAYEDAALPIEAKQTISQPYIVAHMLEAAALQPDDRVLDIGTGSGYAAALLARLAGEVYSIERHASLAQAAAERLAALGFGNVEVRTGDGRLGWPEAAPFDAILGAAGGPHVPDALRRQLAIGGRLVMPRGGRESQELVRITRRGEREYEEEKLGAVRFVPLIGEQGWLERRPPSESPVRREGRAERAATLAGRIRAASEPLPDPEDPAFGALFDRFADARIVLLGEASHGSSEFHRARAAITRRLIEQHGFRIVAVEADWPDAAALDRFAHDLPPREGAPPPFRRFPRWMWRNTDVEAFIGWLRRHNASLPAARQVRFRGLDLYSLGASIEAVIAYLEDIDPKLARIARERYGCLTPWQNDPATYARAALDDRYRGCEKGVVAMLGELLARELDHAAEDPDDWFDATQNARVVAHAERYYRAMYYGAAESWNQRDTHMFETLQQLLHHGGAGAKAVVWAHNSHIGDARATGMGRDRGELNIGQLCREHYGDKARLIGFGTDRGTVAAADDWDEPMRVMDVRPSRADSVERLSLDARMPRSLLDLRPGVHDALREELSRPRLERFIGVIYRPDTERWSHYSEARLSEQFDAWVWFEETRAVTPLAGADRPGAPGVDDTWPFGL
jgi:protein-L-isoaspartate(D-aspartate) O-methyltransferase